MMLPPTLRRLFHRYHAEQLDTFRHADLIISTVLEDGVIDDWRYLFATYGWDNVTAWIADPAHTAQLSPRVERFWTGILLGNTHETPHWVDGNRRRTVPPDALPDGWPTTGNLPE